MTPTEFRALQSAAGLSIRKAAERFGVWPATVQNWRDGRTRIPSEVADRLRELALRPQGKR